MNTAVMAAAIDDHLHARVVRERLAQRTTRVRFRFRNDDEERVRVSLHC
jgi:hypothetical protein